MDMAIEAVFRSWNTERARIYRRRERIPTTWHCSQHLHHGLWQHGRKLRYRRVLHPRPLHRSLSGVYGDYLRERMVKTSLQVSVTPVPGRSWRRSSRGPRRAARNHAETHYRDLCDNESPVERGKLWMPDPRRVPPPPPSALPSSWLTKSSSPAILFCHVTGDHYPGDVLSS